MPFFVQVPAQFSMCVRKPFNLKYCMLAQTMVWPPRNFIEYVCGQVTDAFENLNLVHLYKHFHPIFYGSQPIYCIDSP